MIDFDQQSLGQIHGYGYRRGMLLRAHLVQGRGKQRLSAFPNDRGGEGPVKNWGITG